MSLKTTLVATLVAVCGASALAAAAPAPAPQAASAGTPDLSATYRKLIDDVGPAYVIVKFLMKIEGGRFGDSGEGQEAEVSGLMIEPTGLILCSNTQMGGNQAITSRAGVTLTPTDIKVLIGDDTEGVKAKVVARDSDLDLAWLQIDDVSGKTFKHVTLSDSGPAEIGQRVLKLDRMPKFFDRAIVVTEGRIGGRTAKPRELLIPSGLGGRGELDLGVPLFSETGKFVGLTVLQMPAREDMEGGDAGNMQEMMGVLILPAQRVVTATAHGKEMAASGALDEENRRAEEAAKKDKEAAEKDGDDSGSDADDGDDKTDEPKEP